MATFKDFLGKEADKHDVVLKREQERKARMIVLLARFRTRIDAFDQEYHLQHTADPSTSGKWTGSASQGLEVVKKHLPKSLKSTEANLQEIRQLIFNKIGSDVLWKTAEVSLKTTVNYAGEPVTTSGALIFIGQFTHKHRSFDVQYHYQPGNTSQSGQRKLRISNGRIYTFVKMSDAWSAFLNTEGKI